MLPTLATAGVFYGVATGESGRLSEAHSQYLSSFPRNGERGRSATKIAGYSDHFFNLMATVEYGALVGHVTQLNPLPQIACMAMCLLGIFYARQFGSFEAYARAAFKIINIVATGLFIALGGTLGLVMGGAVAATYLFIWLDRNHYLPEFVQKIYEFAVFDSGLLYVGCIFFSPLWLRLWGICQLSVMGAFKVAEVFSYLFSGERNIRAPDFSLDLYKNRIFLNWNFHVTVD